MHHITNGKHMGVGMKSPSVDPKLVMMTMMINIYGEVTLCQALFSLVYVH